MAFTAVYGENIAEGSIALVQNRKNTLYADTIGLGLWYHTWETPIYDTEGHIIGYETHTETVNLKSRYKFRVEKRCSAVTVKAEYTRAQGTTEGRSFYAAVSESGSAWNELSAADTKTFTNTEDVYTATFTAEGDYEPETDYYLYLWTAGSGSSGSLGTRYNTSSYGNLTATLSAKTTGGAHIDGGIEWEEGTVWIDNGTSWEQYTPYIDNGTSWEQCG